MIMGHWRNCIDYGALVELHWLWGIGGIALIMGHWWDCIDCGALLELHWRTKKYYSDRPWTCRFPTTKPTWLVLYQVR